MNDIQRERIRSENRFFDPDPTIRSVAVDLYQEIAADLPIVCPHGHVDPRLFVDPNATFGSPADLFIIPDHYVFRMLYSQGIAIGIPGSTAPGWRRGGTGSSQRSGASSAKTSHLFRGTPSGVWLTDELASVFGITEKPSASNADRLFDLISEKLVLARFFSAQTLRTIQYRSALHDRCLRPIRCHIIKPSVKVDGVDASFQRFRPDGVVNFDAPNWRANIDKLSEVSRHRCRGLQILSFVHLEQRRAFFKSMGATATDHAALVPATAELTPVEAEAIFQRALKGEWTAADAARFTAHMLMEMARMSIEDGLVMQLHPGSFRNHNEVIFEKFGPDKGADIPIQTEYTRNLLPLLNKYGNDPRLTLILFTLDETAYSRELAPLAGHYPALKLGPPWWFFDSLNGMARYFDQVMETAGLYNTAGFNDDTRAFCSIPARHDVWRRASANWLAGLVARHIIDMNDAREMMQDLTVNLVKRAI